MAHSEKGLCQCCGREYCLIPGGNLETYTGLCGSCEEEIGTLETMFGKVEKEK